MKQALGIVLAGLRRMQTQMQLLGTRRFLRHGPGLHVGKGCRLWAPERLQIGRDVYIGKHVHIEANCEIGDFCLIANRVGIVGRHDHDFSVVGLPMRYSPWAYSRRFGGAYAGEKAVIESDVWIGYGTIILTGTTIGRGCVVAAGSVVTRDIPPYSIAGGVPARVIRRRFADDETIRRHEAAMAAGRFEFSERGYDYCLIEPASAEKGAS